MYVVFGCTFHFNPLPDYVKRYPLANANLYGYDDKVIRAERLFYINAKYAAAQAQAAVQVAS